MFETIQALSSTYDCLLPADVMKETDKLISILVRHLSEYDINDNYDFYDSKFIQRVTFKKIKRNPIK